MNDSPNDLWLAFRDGHKFELDGGDRFITMRPADAGSLILPSGRIVASDPILNAWNPPFKTSIAPGTYPVHIALGNEDVAFVMVLFDDGPPTRWRKAKPPYFSVDSATGCLMDFRVARFLRQKAEAGKYDRYTHIFDNALVETGLWANVPIGSSANVVLFHTWGGDGSFSVNFGLDDDDAPICLVIDMLPR
jgi:hypothetical protein